ncbi:hypothetical protein BS636_08385 [Acinetobacter sp. LoGeW2-3]|uniref:hypothetical protein n=1 Tax=Acinetobacter sp. LoGeW2-3 TaxID=1808001 RepID=UPI000C05AFF9|nr:hypothetical protein [Acinetobacter sp. LoGeW2-3]ATO19668.1 hypothetical protein BS636_08385 [Acinetobacter sp. LoGeW2-3]
MTNYEVEISYPHQDSSSNGLQVETLASEEVLAKFNSMNWNQLLILQLQMQTGKTTFTVTNTDSGQSIQITLNELSNSQQLEFKLESDIQVEGVNKSLFGFLGFKGKNYVSYRELNLKQTQAILDHFVTGNIEAIKQQYQSSLNQVSQIASRA